MRSSSGAGESGVRTRVEVDRHGVFALVARISRHLEVVRGALLVSGGRQRIRTQQANSIGTEPDGRDDVVREWSSGGWVINHARPPEEKIAGVEQLAEVAPPHGQGRDGHVV